MKVMLLTARIRLETDGGVAGTEVPTEQGNKLPLRRDPDGKIHLPGTTVAGSLREHCGEELDDLFGSSEREPSAIQVLGTIYRPVAEKPLYHTRTAIDRWRGAAKTHTYHEVEQLPRGTEFDIMLRWNNPDPLRCKAFMDKIRSWHPRLGRGVTHGAGQCRLIGWGIADYDLATPDDLLRWVRDTGLASYPVPTTPPETEPAIDTLLDLPMEIVDGLRCGIGDENKPEGESRALYRLDGEPAIPGSTLKGIVRSHAEYICRVVGVTACTDQTCGECRPCRIFGSGGEENAKRGAIVVHGAVIENPTVEKKRPHVAIDRFTGGYKDSALYTDELVVAGRFRLRIDRIGTLEEGDLPLLNAVITDLHDGLIGIGENTMGGYGTVRVADPDWERPEDLTSLAALLRKDAA
jgi:CRISPR/Cas system CSM-associated protein Csm3 (group 7 of RAMP superfamily)